MEPDHKFGYVYIIDCKNGDWKIGSTSRLLNRIEAHRAYFGNDAQIITITKCESPALAYQIEQWIHCWLWEHIHHHECFALGSMSKDEFIQSLTDFYKTQLRLLITDPQEPVQPSSDSLTGSLVHVLESPFYWYAPQPLPKRPFQAMSRWSLSQPGAREKRTLMAARGESLSQIRRDMWASLTPEERERRSQAVKNALAKPERKRKRSETQRHLMRDPDRRQRAIQALRDAAKRPEDIARRRELMLKRNADPAYQRKAQSGRWRSFKSRGVSPNQLTLFGEDAVMLNFHPTADTQPNAYDCMDFLNYTDLGFARERGGPLPGDRSWFRLFAYVGDLNASTTTICQTLYIVDDRIDNVLAYMWECWKPGLQWLMEEAQKAGYIPGDPAPIHPRTESGLLREGFTVSSRVVQLEQKPRSVTENCFERYVA